CGSAQLLLCDAELLLLCLFCYSSFSTSTIRDSYWEKKSKAAGLRATANHLRDLNPEDVHEILRQAAEIFEGIGIINIVAQCLSDLGDHEKAASSSSTFYTNLKF
ncbi:hypothetical protein S245_048319, partial [Arachis hypogaea]